MSLKGYGVRAFWSFGIVWRSVLPWRPYLCDLTLDNDSHILGPVPPMLDDDIQWLRRNGVFVRSAYKEVEARLQEIINHESSSVG